MSLGPGQRLGPYEVLRPLGTGGMGQVWRARDTRLGREVALKVLPDEFAESAERRSRLEHEAKLPIRMPAHRAAAWFGIVSLTAIAATSFFVDGLQYSVVSFLPFLALMSIVYARARRGTHA